MVTLSLVIQVERLMAEESDCSGEWFVREAMKKKAGKPRKVAFERAKRGAGLLTKKEKEVQPLDDTEV